MITKETRKSLLYIFNLENKKKIARFAGVFFFIFVHIAIDFVQFTT